MEAPPSPFRDIGGNTHELAIDCLHWFEAAQGVTPTQYAPAGTVRRDQLASFLARALDTVRVALPPAGDRFSDADGNVHEDNIERLAAAGIVTGTENCQHDPSARCAYDPAGYVSRGQMATLVLRAYDFISGDGVPACERGPHDYFSDDDGTAHECHINRATGLTLVLGKTDYGYQDDSVYHRGTYAPHEALRRDQMASMIGGLLGHGVGSGPGSLSRPYARGTSVLLKDGWSMAVIGSDNDATLEVLLHNPENTPPAADHRFVVARVRATYSGPGTSTFDGGGRLAATHYGHRHSSTGRPCGDIPDELQNPPTSNGGTVAGNVCFEVLNDHPDPLVVDLRWTKPAPPHFSRYTPDDQEEASPYRDTAPTA